jgi:hypothetical protein
MKRITWINLILGIWLIIAPFVIGYAAVSGVAVGEDVILGILLVLFSWWILAAEFPPVGTAWFQVFCGIWLIVAPFVLAYQGLPRATGNDITAGIIAIVVGLIESRAVAHVPPRTTA